MDGKECEKVKSNAIFNNIKNNPVVQNVLFDKALNGRYLKFYPVELTNKSEAYVVAELGIITR